MFKTFYHELILRPLKTVYIYGPECHGLGFWAGKTNAQICASLTGTAETFWNNNVPECTDLIDQKFYSLQVTIESIFYFTALFYIAKTIGSYLTRVIEGRKTHRSPPMLVFSSIDGEEASSDTSISPIRKLFYYHMKKPHPSYKKK